MGDYYGFFWWLPQAIDDETEGTFYKKLQQKTTKKESEFEIMDDIVSLDKELGEIMKDYE